MTIFKKAILREPNINFSNALTTSKHLGPIDFEQAKKQHLNYQNILRKLGLEITILKPSHKYPDAPFIEDTAILTSDFSIITRPGAISRKGEIFDIEKILKKIFKDCYRIENPGTLDGGDVLLCDKTFFIGISDRTNFVGAEQFKRIVQKYNYNVHFIELSQGLHLKSSINLLPENTLILTEKYKTNKLFNSYKHVIVDNDEAYSANSLTINGTVIVPKGFPNTIHKINKLNFNIIEIDISEFRKVDGGLTCLSLRY